jgi:hypothetical protein
VFGHVLQIQQGDPDWDPEPSMSAALVVGIRVIDSLFDDAVAGIRIGAEQGFGSLERFGVVLGASYSFRRFVKDKTVQQPGEDPQTTEQRDVDKEVGNRWGAYVAIDFAF